MVSPASPYAAAPRRASSSSGTPSPTTFSACSACAEPQPSPHDQPSAGPTTPSKTQAPSAKSRRTSDNFSPSQDEVIFLMPSTNLLILSRAAWRASRRTHHVHHHSLPEDS